LLTVMSASILIGEGNSARRERCVAAPLDPNMPAHRILEAIEQLKCDGLVSTVDVLQKIKCWNDTSKVPGSNVAFNKEEDAVRARVLNHLQEIRVVRPSDMDIFCDVKWECFEKSSTSTGWKERDSPESTSGRVPPPHGNSNSHSLLLRTSGTTSTPKIVPLTPRMLLYNALCISSSLRLTRDDVDCNAMPFYHIGGIACALFSVLVSGSSVIMMGSFEPNAFLDLLVSKEDNGKRTVYPTWYYGVPTMHKSLVLVARARLDKGKTDDYHPNKLRFIRSGAAHLANELALQLADIFRTRVIPTYSMSECMPVCSSSDPIDPSSNHPIDTVGCPIGPSVRIIDSDENILPRGEGAIGELVLQGPGVLNSYLGIPREKTHTKDGWLKTGDNGWMDEEGRVFLKGRSKEMIKRGGEQIWPNQIDDVLEQLPEIATAVAFGVPNDLWGEEVAAAVVLHSPTAVDERDALRETFIDACRSKLEDAAVPRQILFVAMGDLLKGPTGKYLRTKMASHLNVTAVDLGALKVLESTATTPTHSAITPSEALNGLRFVTACHVVQVHVGLYPSLAWLKIQTFSLNMTIFFILGAFQLTCAVSDSVLHKWGRFVGTKIGTMHALFVITQVMALPAWASLNCEGLTCAIDTRFLLITWILATLTGMLGVFNAVNPISWFQTVFYVFLTLFPFLDKWFRNLNSTMQAVLLVLFTFLATIIFAILSLGGDFGLFQNYSIISWLPVLMAGMIMGHIWRRLVKGCHKQDLAGTAKKWGFIADGISCILIVLEVVNVLQPSCAIVNISTFQKMRPGYQWPEESWTDNNDSYANICGITYDEFTDFVHPSPNILLNNMGRMSSEFAESVGYVRFGTPLVLLWIFSLSFGHGVSARILGSFSWLSPIAYPVYLLHGPIGLIYWRVTRGSKTLFWFEYAFGYPIPVAWWEAFLILFLCCVVGWLIDAYIVPKIMPYTIKLWVWVAERICSYCCCCCCCCYCCKEERDDGNDDDTSILGQIKCMVKDLTGGEVNRSTELSSLGLDSLGATALLSLVQLSIPSAGKKLKVHHLTKMNTVGELVDFIEGTGSLKDSDGDFAV